MIYYTTIWGYLLSVITSSTPIFSSSQHQIVYCPFIFHFHNIWECIYQTYCMCSFLIFKVSKRLLWSVHHSLSISDPSIRLQPYFSKFLEFMYFEVITKWESWFLFFDNIVAFFIAWLNGSPVLFLLLLPSKFRLFSFVFATRNKFIYFSLIDFFARNFSIEWDINSTMYLVSYWVVYKYLSLCYCCRFFIFSS